MKRTTAANRRPGHKHKPTKVDKDKIVTKYNDYNCLTTSGTLCICHEITNFDGVESTDDSKACSGSAK